MISLSLFSSILKWIANASFRPVRVSSAVNGRADPLPTMELTGGRTGSSRSVQKKSVAEGSSILQTLENFTRLKKKLRKGFIIFDLCITVLKLNILVSKSVQHVLLQLPTETQSNAFLLFRQRQYSLFPLGVRFPIVEAVVNVLSCSFQITLD